MLVVAAIALGVGARVLRGLGLSDAPLPERACFTLSIGLGCVAYGVFLLGLLHLLWPAPVLALLLVLALLGARPGWQLAREGFAAVRERRLVTGALGAVTGTMVALLLLMVLAAALAPPSGNDWDGLSYHLADPAIYLRHRAIIPLFWESHSYFPFTIEMLYTLALMAKSPGGARAFHWLFLALNCAIVAGAWRRLWPHAPASARWLAPLFLVTAPVALWGGTVAYNDLALMAYELLALYGVWLWARGGRLGWLWAGALCLGLALGTKFTGLLQAGLLAPVVLVAALRAKEGSGAALRRLLAWGGIAAAVGAPWYIRSYIHTRNPVYPFFYNLFPNTRFWSAKNAAVYSAAQDQFGMGRGLSHLLTVPWDLLAHAERFTDGQPAFAILFGSLGPVFLALAPVVLLLRRRDPVAAGLLLFAAAYVLAWFGMSAQTRYLLPVLPLLALAGARGLCGLVEEGRMARFPAIGLVAVQTGIAAFIALQLLAPVLPVLTGGETRGEYLRRTLGPYPVMEYANAVLPSEARVMLIEETRGFYLDRDYLWGSPGHHTAIPWPTFRDGAEMQRFLTEKMGITHVLINHGIVRWETTPADWTLPLYEAFRSGTLTPLHSERGYALYAFE